MEAVAQGWPLGICKRCPGEQQLGCGWSRADSEGERAGPVPTEGGLEDSEGKKPLPRALRWPLRQHEDTGPSEAWSWRPLCRSQVGLGPGKLRYREGCHPPGLLTLHWDSLDPLSHMLLRESLRRPFGKPPARPGPRGPRSTPSALGTPPWAESSFVLRFQYLLCGVAATCPFVEQPHYVSPLVQQ